MSDYCPATDGRESYLAWCRYMRERLLREGTYKIPPVNEHEQRIAEARHG